MPKIGHICTSDDLNNSKPPMLTFNLIKIKHIHFFLYIESNLTEHQNRYNNHQRFLKYRFV